MMLTKRPGIYFETVPPPEPPVLPRMDIAAFVGFAACGPLNVPVAVEEIGRFRDIFGPDLPLAWDTERGQMQHAHLGQTVEAFFRNGGQRCYVVRVADEQLAVTAAWQLPGVATAETLQPTTVSARCPGSWADALRVGTVLQSEPLRLHLSRGDVLQARVSGARPLQAGDLLRITLDNSYLFLAIDQALTVTPYQVTQVAGQWVSAAAEALPETTLAYRLTFDLHVWHAEQRVSTLSGLGFHPDHARSYMKLPADADLFKTRDENDNLHVLTAFEQSVATPRFPLAFSGTGQVTLPLDMSTQVDFEQSVFALTDRTPARRLLRDGLTTLEEASSADFTTVFLDPDLKQASQRSLLSLAHNKLYLQNRPLHGIHAVLPLEDVSLIAIPDASHAGWMRTERTAVDTLAIPELSLTGADGGAELSWTSVPDATHYRVQWSQHRDFTQSAEATTLATTLTQTLSELCPTRYYFRVAAWRDNERGAWSNSETLLFPTADFSACATHIERTPVLELTQAPTELQLSWTETEDTPYVWQSAEDPDFSIGVKSAEQDDPLHLLPTPQGQTYFRVRTQHSAWSNSVVFTPQPPSEWELSPPEQDAFTLRTLHNALLRFCAARADLFAILSLPVTMQREAAERYQQQLQAISEAAQLSYGALYHPWLVQATSAGGYTLSPPDGAVLGLYAQRANTRGAWIAPANQPLSGVIALGLVNANADVLNNRINWIERDPRGFLTLRAETLSLTSSYRPINVRRLLILLRRLALREGQTYVFEMIGPAFRRLVQHRFEQLLTLLYERGAFAGASAEASFQVSINNTRQDLEQGRFIVELRVAPAQPLTFIVVRLVQTERAALSIVEV